MSQILGRLTDEQVRVLFQRYCQGQLARSHVQKLLEIGKSRFYALLKACRQDPNGLSTRSANIDSSGALPAELHDGGPATSLDMLPSPVLSCAPVKTGPLIRRGPHLGHRRNHSRPTPFGRSAPPAAS